MFEKNIPDEDLERLSRAIAEAIFSSKDVRKIIKEIREKDLAIPHTMMVMVFKLETLANIAKGDLGNLKEPRKNKKKTIKQFIDGKALDANEIAFQEFLIKKFDDKEWLKKNGLIF